MNLTLTTLVLESTTLYCICVGFSKRIAGRAQKQCYCISCSESRISINTSIQVSANHGDIALHFYHFYKNYNLECVHKEKRIIVSVFYTEKSGLYEVNPR